MRNGHHHNNQKRMRGRNRNNNRGHNPLTRVYESNGPDVKIRGTAHHIAEKYLQLARDAQSAGDPVSSEGYLQHAEHYFRLIAAAQAQYAQQNPNQPQQIYQRPDLDADGDDAEGEETDEANAQPYAGGQPVQPVQQHRPQNPQQQPQPSYNPPQNPGGLPAFITGGQQQPSPNGYDGEQGGNRNDRNDRNNRYGRNRNRHFRQGNNEHRNNNNYQGEGQPPQQGAAPAADQPQPEPAPVAGSTPAGE